MFRLLASGTEGVASMVECQSDRDQSSMPRKAGTVLAVSLALGSACVRDVATEPVEVQGDLTSLALGHESGATSRFC